MLLRFLLLMTLLPLAELVLLFLLARTSFWLALGEVVGSAVLGVLLIQFRGAVLGLRFGTRVVRDPLAPDIVIEATCLLVVGALWVLPGLITDIAGITLLIPPIRRWYWRRWSSWLGGYSRFWIRRYQSATDQATIDAEFRPGPINDGPAATPFKPSRRIDQR